MVHTSQHYGYWNSCAKPGDHLNNIITLVFVINIKENQMLKKTEWKNAWLHV